jgi:hypothetical protein
MKSRVAGTSESDAWHGALSRFPEADVYFLPEYHRAYELNGDGTALAFMAEEKDQFFFILSSCAASKAGWPAA